MKTLTEEFLAPYKTRPVDWGFPSGPNSLGEITYRRTYSRPVVVFLKDTDQYPAGLRLYGKSVDRYQDYLQAGNARLENEAWWETVYRVVEGTYGVLRNHCRRYHLPFHEETARKDAEEMYERIFSFKFTPPGRGLWMMGTDFVRERGGMALNNCSFVSTKDLATEFSKPFRFLMDVSMLGVGCGFDTRGKGTVLWDPDDSLGTTPHAVEDSREGWVELIGEVLDWGFGLCPRPLPDVSRVRQYGTPINGFGGVASGPEPLLTLYQRIVDLVLSRKGRPVSSRDIVDLMNFIGCCVVAGNVRRTAEIAFGDLDDGEFLDLKDYDKNPERAGWGWTSNNTVFAEEGSDYAPLEERRRARGEMCGVMWLENARRFGRMKDPENNRDWRVLGTNPCGEQSLESYEVCNLVENFLHRHKDLADFRRTLKYSYLYAKAVSLLSTHWEETNAVMLRNRRIGCSVSGVVQFLTEHSERKLIAWLDEGYKTVRHYDRVYSEWLAVRESIKTTSVKPSGTVSLLAGATPGGHYPTHRDYVRRIRFSKSHPDVPAFREAGYPVEPDARDPYTVVVEFPVRGPDVPTEDEVSVGRKFRLASLLQRHWADNQVSYTVTFHPEREGHLLGDNLRAYEGALKGISFLPLVEGGMFPQMPYEGVSKKEFERRSKGLKRITWPKGGSSHDQEDKYCDGGACEVKPG